MVEIETFEVDEIGVVEHPEVADEALRIIEECGLEGQKKLVTKPEAAEVGTRIPYRKMTEEETFVYSVLLPGRFNVENYSQQSIPLRVLQVIAHAKEHFGYLEVWDEATIKDPVLVGRKERYSGDNFILARWGSVLEAFPVLREKAIALSQKTRAMQARSIIAKLQPIASCPESQSLDDMMGFSGRFEAIEVSGL